VAEIFSRITRTNIARMEKLRACADKTGSAELVCSDARELTYEYSLNGNRNKPLADESVQLIITSPPYPGAQKYIRSCSLSLGWLKLCPTTDLRACKARIIGREELTKAECSGVLPINIPKAERVLAAIRKRNPIRAMIAATYLNEMRIAIGEMYRVLKPGGHIVLVAANNRISGKEFRTADYLQTIAKECGLSLTACFIDAIRSRGLMTKRNHTASVITREWVLIFSKGGSQNGHSANAVADGEDQNAARNRLGKACGKACNHRVVGKFCVVESHWPRRTSTCAVSVIKLYVFRRSGNPGIVEGVIS
jgi:hypothetical protein